jgi:hypothetical protein
MNTTGKRWLLGGLMAAMALLACTQTNTFTGPSDSTAAELARTSVPKGTALTLQRLRYRYDVTRPLDTLVVAAVTTQGLVDATVTGNVTVSLANNPTATVLHGTLTRPFVKGLATFADLKIDTIASNYALLAQSTRLKVVSPPFKVVDVKLWAVVPVPDTLETPSPTCVSAVKAGTAYVDTTRVATCRGARWQVQRMCSFVVWTDSVATNVSGGPVCTGRFPAWLQRQ